MPRASRGCSCSFFFHDHSLSYDYDRSHSDRACFFGSQPTHTLSYYSAKWFVRHSKAEVSSYRNILLKKDENGREVESQLQRLAALRAGQQSLEARLGEEQVPARGGIWVRKDHGERPREAYAKQLRTLHSGGRRPREKLDTTREISGRPREDFLCLAASEFSRNSEKISSKSVRKTVILSKNSENLRKMCNFCKILNDV